MPKKCHYLKMRRGKQQPTTPSSSETSHGYLLTLVKDLNEIKAMAKAWNFDLTFPNGPNDITHFNITFHIKIGIYKGGSYTFSFYIPPGFRIERPVVRILTDIWHPNIMPPKYDADGNHSGGEICLSVLRSEYKPTNPLHTIVTGLAYLFHAPNPDDPLNQEAAIQMRNNYEGFCAKVEEMIMKQQENEEEDDE